jgi:hypothetical protein
MKIEIPVAHEDQHFVEDDHGVTRTTNLGGFTVAGFGPGGLGQYDAGALAEQDRTRDTRRGVAAVRDAANLRAAVTRTPRDLDRLWRSAAPAAEKRALLFEMWDECAESGPADVVDSARAVRAAIVAFIRRRLPPGSPDAFTAAELRALDRRRTSAEHFDPYARYTAP